jgi:hypothetical protein
VYLLDTLLSLVNLIEPRNSARDDGACSVGMGRLYRLMWAGTGGGLKLFVFPSLP